MSRIIDFAAPVGQKAGAGHWNDLDMLEVGNGGMNYDEYGEHSGLTFWVRIRVDHCAASNALLNVEHP